jgi:hypothetical protein
MIFWQFYLHPILQPAFQNAVFVLLLVVVLLLSIYLQHREALQLQDAYTM